MDFSHNFIILIDVLSQPWDLLGFRFLIIAKMSSSLIFNNERVSSVLRSKVGRLFEFCNRVHGDAKHLLKIHAF